MRITLLATAILLLTSAFVQAGSGPIPNDDFGGGNFGLEPNPPNIEPPNLDIVSTSLGTITSLDVSGMLPGDSVMTQLGDATLLFQSMPDGSLVTSLIGTDGVRTMTLPPLDPSTSSNFLALITPATVSVDRVGANPTDGSMDPSHVVDGTLVTYGLVKDLGTLGDNGPVPNPSEVQQPPNVSTVAQKIPLASPLDSVMELAVVDPENNLIIGTLQDHTSQIPTTDTVSSTSAQIKNALDTNALTGLNLNSVLSGLSSSTKLLGAVDTNLLATNLVDLGYAMRVVDLPQNKPATILDPAHKQLILVDGGLGKMVAVPGAEKLNFDNNLVTALKEPKSTDLTSFVAVSKIGNDKALGKTLFHPTLGNYQELLQKTDPLTKRGFTSAIMPAGVSCKTQLAQQMGQNAPGFCMLPTADAFPVKGANALGSLVNPTQNPALAGTKAAKAMGLESNGIKPPGTPGGPALPGKEPVPQNLGAGTPTGNLKDLPDAKNFMGAGGAFTAFQEAPKDLSKYQLGDWKLPDKGLGALPEVDAPNADAVKDVGCKDTCLPDHTPSIPDGIMEGFQAPAMPGIVPVVPTDGLTGVVGTVMGASGSGMALIPADLLKGLPLGLTSATTFRFVGASDSIYGNTGIPGVKAQIESTDPFGLSKSTFTKESNTNGYIVADMPSLGNYKLVATKDGFESVDGAGASPAPGQNAGQEYTMQAHSGNSVADAAKNHGVSLILLAAGAVLGGLWVKNRVNHRKAKKGATK